MITLYSTVRFNERLAQYSTSYLDVTATREQKAITGVQVYRHEIEKELYNIIIYDNPHFQYY